MTPTNSIIEKLQAQFGGAVQAASEFRGEWTVTVRPESLPAVVRTLRDDLGFDHLANLTAVDWSQYPGYTGKERFTTVYHLVSTTSGARLALKVPVAGDSPAVATLTGLWPGANWPEREAYDLMGVKFDGHPDLRRILLPLNWPNHPLRKDVPRGGR